MKLYFPDIYPDELAYSWFARYGIYEGFPANIQILDAIYCNRALDNPSKEFVGNINNKVKEYIDSKYSLQKFVLDHTMFPQYARFLPAEQKVNAIHKICHEFDDIHHILPIVPRCEKERYFKYCPICAEEDRKQYGETYWHRKHQIRNIIICTKHKCKLNNSIVPANNKDSRLLISAEEVLPYKSDIIYANNQLQLQFGTYIANIFDKPMNFNNNIPIRATLYFYMKDTEYMQSNGRYKHMKKLIDDMHEYYNTAEINEFTNRSKIQNLLMGNAYDLSTIYQIGFFFKIPVKELTSSKLTKKHIEQEKKAHYIEQDWNQYDKDMFDSVKTLASNIYNGKNNKTGKPEKVMPTIVCKELNIKPHEIKNMKMCNDVLNKYSEPYPELWARRLVWAYNKLKNEKNNFYWTDLKRVSGVVKANFETILPYLEKHTDQNTIEKIKDIVYCKNNTLKYSL